MEYINRFYENFNDTRKFYGLICVITLCHFIIRGLLYPSEPNDGAEQLLFSQVFLLGYDIVNPPLYTWLVIAFQELFSVKNVIVTLIKFIAYGLSFHFLYVLAYRTIGDKRLSILAALSPLWLYYMAWDVILSYTHTVLATMFILASLVALQRLRAKGNLLSYVVFGGVVGLGFISKYTFALSALTLLVSSLICPPYRAPLMRPMILVTLAVAFLIVAPHGYWLIENSSEIGHAVASKFEVRVIEGGFFANRLGGLKSVAASFIGFTSPLWLILLVVFWRPIQERLRQRASLSPPARLLATYICVSIALIFSFVLIFGVTKVRAHYMFVILPFPIAFFAWLKPSLDQSFSLKIYGVSLISIALLLVGGMALKYLAEPKLCKRCQLLMPYKDIAQKIRADGFRHGTIFATYFPHDLAGNLRSFFPEARIVSIKYPTITRPLGTKRGQCLIIWMPEPWGRMGNHHMIEFTNKYLKSNISLENVPLKTIEYQLDRAPTRTRKLHYILLDPGVGQCR